jgi:hypothetical protein
MPGMLFSLLNSFFNEMAVGGKKMAEGAAGGNQRFTLVAFTVVMDTLPPLPPPEDDSMATSSAGPITWLLPKSTPFRCLSLQWLHTRSPILEMEDFRFRHLISMLKVLCKTHGRIFPVVV